jgi:predicted component of type VI protein secretion system
LGQKFSFVDASAITIGRGSENQISLPNDPRISRVHVEIRQENDVIYVLNKTDKNPMLINGHKEDQLKVGQSCVITVGESEIKFHYPQTAKSYKNPLQPLSPTSIPVGLPQQSAPTSVPGPVLKSQYQMPSTYATPPTASPNAMANKGAPPKRRKIPKKESSSLPIILVLIVAVIIVVFFVLPNKPEESVRPEKPTEIVTPVYQDEMRMKDSMDRAKEALLKMENQNSRQAMARQFFISGMREFLNGNYHRAVSFLNSAYQSDPTLADAEKFAREAQRKLDRLIDFYFSEGLKYRENNNYRMCKSSFQTVQLYIRNSMKHPRYVEAKQFYDECSNLDRVRRF